jgi:hypothetical protein
MRKQKRDQDQGIRLIALFSARGPDDGCKDRINKAAMESDENRVSEPRVGRP